MGLKEITLLRPTPKASWGIMPGRTDGHICVHALNPAGIAREQLKVGDRIIAINGLAVSSEPEVVQQLNAAYAKATPKRGVTISINRSSRPSSAAPAGRSSRRPTEEEDEPSARRSKSGEASGQSWRDDDEAKPKKSAAELFEEERKSMMEKVRREEREANDKKKIAQLTRQHREQVRRAKDAGLPIPEEPKELRVLEQKVNGPKSAGPESSSERGGRGRGGRAEGRGEGRASGRGGSSSVRRESSAERQSKPVEAVRREPSAERQSKPADAVRRELSSDRESRSALKASSKAEGKAKEARREKKASRKDPARQSVRWEDEEEDEEEEPAKPLFKKTPRAAADGEKKAEEEKAAEERKAEERRAERRAERKAEEKRAEKKAEEKKAEEKKAEEKKAEKKAEEKRAGKKAEAKKSAEKKDKEAEAEKSDWGGKWANALATSDDDKEAEDKDDEPKDKREDKEEDKEEEAPKAATPPKASTPPKPQDTKASVSAGQGVAAFLAQRSLPVAPPEEEIEEPPAPEPGPGPEPEPEPEPEARFVAYQVPTMPGSTNFGGPPSPPLATPKPQANVPAGAPKSPGSREHLPQPEALTKAYLLIGGGVNGKPSRQDVLDACCDATHALRGLLGLPAQVNPSDIGDFESVFDAMSKIEKDGFISEADFCLFADSAIEFCRLRAGSAAPAALPDSISPGGARSCMSWCEGRLKESTRSSVSSVKPLLPGTKRGAPIVLKRHAAASLAEQCAAAVLDKKEREDKAGKDQQRSAAERLIEEENEKRRRGAEKARVEAFEVYERERAEQARLRVAEREMAVQAATLGATEARRLARVSQEATRRKEREDRELQEAAKREMRELAEVAEREARWEAEVAEQTATALAAAERAKKEAIEEEAAAEAARVRLEKARVRREAEEMEAEEAEAAASAGVAWSPSRSARSARAEQAWQEDEAEAEAEAEADAHGGAAEAEEEEEKPSTQLRALMAAADEESAEERVEADIRLQSLIDALSLKEDRADEPSQEPSHDREDPFMATAAAGVAPLVAHHSPASQRRPPVSDAVAHKVLVAPPSPPSRYSMPARASTELKLAVSSTCASLTPMGAQGAPSRPQGVPSNEVPSTPKPTPNRAVANLVRQTIEVRTPQQGATPQQGGQWISSRAPPHGNPLMTPRRGSGGSDIVHEEASPPSAVQPAAPSPRKESLLATRKESLLAPSQSRPPARPRCSLLFSEANGGCFLEQWSSTLVEGALAAFVPQRPVPEYKLHNNGGRSEILRDAGGPNAKRFFMGWAHFAKIARQSDGIFCHLANLKQLPVAFYLHDEQMRVARLPLGVSTDLRSVVSVAVTPALAPDLRVSSLESSLFHHIGGRIGATLELEEHARLSHSPGLHTGGRTPPSWAANTRSGRGSSPRLVSSPRPADWPMPNSRDEFEDSEVVSIAPARGSRVASAPKSARPTHPVGYAAPPYAAPRAESVAARPNGPVPANGAVPANGVVPAQASNGGAVLQTRLRTRSPLAQWLCEAPPSVSTRATTALKARSERSEPSVASSPNQNVWRCYLLFSEANGGCFLEQWSPRLVEGALAAFMPQRPVPSFKLRANGGRSEILRDAGGPNVKRFFVGWTHFVKAARHFDGVFCHLANLKQLPVAIYLHDDQVRVARLPLGVSTDVRRAMAVAVIPALAPDLRVSRLESTLFHQIGGRVGASLVLEKDTPASVAHRSRLARRSI